MIRVSSISNLRKIEDYQHQFDKVWAIVRSLSRPIPGVKQVAVPSPSVDLFHKYLAKKNAKEWEAGCNVVLDSNNDYSAYFKQL